jgi:hypothetical protein
MPRSRIKPRRFPVRITDPPGGAALTAGAVYEARLLSTTGRVVVVDDAGQPAYLERRRYEPVDDEGGQ